MKVIDRVQFKQQVLPFCNDSTKRGKAAVFQTLQKDILPKIVPIRKTTGKPFPRGPASAELAQQLTSGQGNWALPSRAIMGALRMLDLFPKVPTDLSQATVMGGWFSTITGVLMLLLFQVPRAAFT